MRSGTAVVVLLGLAGGAAAAYRLQTDDGSWDEEIFVRSPA
ncbi:hypothetical protein [Micromonospora halophytica]|uniref:Uncharacterized protein n=1 Tax=Micromonospora halophytica TaxID=47864 RepID=A0A1C5I8Z1_9ACTN|nr:hypothetical protein [Micromonospora halophytica]SCG54850.1 hypothetical protein GA0070560_10960 [Micromonospora halophytica]